MDDFNKYEEELYQIIRMHNNDIKITLTFSADYGVPFYYATMVINDKKFTSQGRNLWKRYKDFVNELHRIYGENVYKYGYRPIYDKSTYFNL